MRAVPSDPRPPQSRDPGSSEPPSYDETLWVPLRWWALATMLHASVLVAFLVALPLSAALSSVGVFALGTAAFFLTYGGVSLRVEEGSFSAGRARIPVAYLAEPEALDETATRLAAGVEADARAYLVLRPYARGSVRVRVLDPDDPVPYWLISTRRPRALSDALAAAISTARGDLRS